MTKILLALLVLLVTAFAGEANAASSCPGADPIIMRGDQKTVTVDGEVTRDQKQCWILPVSTGEHIKFSIVSPDKGNSATFTIYKPGWGFSQDAKNTVAVKGNQYAGAKDGDDAQAWSGTADASGLMLIVVERKRGTAVYHLTTTAK